MARFLRADDLKRHVRTVHSKDVDNHLCAPSLLTYMTSFLLYLLSNIVELDPKKQSKSKRGVADIPEPQRGRGYQPYSTPSPHHRRSTSDVDAVADYDLSQLPQAQPPAFFTHGQGQRYGAYGKVVHRLKVPKLYWVARRWYSMGACGLCPRRGLSGTLGRWKTRRWEDPLSCLLNILLIIALSRDMKMEHSMLKPTTSPLTTTTTPTPTPTSTCKSKFEINCSCHHVSELMCGVRIVLRRP